MTRCRKMAVVPLALSCLCAALPAAVEQGPWKLKLDRAGVSVFSARVEGSRLHAFRGECVLDAPLEVVGQVMIDVAAYPEWVADCAEARKFDCTDLTTCRLYFALALPWPVRDREVVMRSRTDIMLEEGRIVGRVEACDGDDVPVVRERVRITAMTGKWIFERMGHWRTRATFVTWADPAGYIPPIIFNHASVSVPFRTLKGLQAMVLREEYARAAREFDWSKFR